MKERSSTRNQVRDAEILATGKRFCSGCYQTRDADKGIKRKFRWICDDCLERAKEHMRRRA
jgi:hypothetical protein